MKVTAKSADLFFPQITTEDRVNPDEVTLSLHPCITVIATRSENGSITLGRPIIDSCYASDFGKVEGYIGKRWASRAMPVAKKYFAERPPRFHDEAAQ